MKFSEIESNILLEYPVGSHLYGTATKNSDHDFSGIFVAPVDYYLGLKSVEEADFSSVSKNASGKNSKDAIDKKYYELRKFAKLAADCNPSIIEHLFIPQSYLLVDSKDGQLLLKNRKGFLHKGLYHRFLGYAYSQKKKMLVKLENKEKLEYIKSVLLAADPRDTVYQCKAALKSEFKDEHLLAGDIKIPLGCLVKKAITIINKRFAGMSHRTELIKKHGYDTKFMSHTIRLVLEGIEILTTGDLVFPLKEAELITNIKLGKYSLEEVLTMFNTLETQIKLSMSTTDLPKTANFDLINNLCVSIIQKRI